MSPKEIGETVCDAFDAFAEMQPTTRKWDELRERLWMWFRSVDEPLAFEGMLWVFERSDRYQHQQLAGELLARRKLPLMIPPQAFIRRIAPRLSASASEVAKYLRMQVGDEAVLHHVNALARTATDERLCRGLDALSYWLGTSGKAQEANP